MLEFKPPSPYNRIKPDMIALKAPFHKLFFLFILLVIVHQANSQNYITELHSKLSASDQKKITKADAIFKKATDTEAESNKLLTSDKEKDKSKATKKADIKRLEADGYYKDAFESKYKVYQTNINQFLKNYKGDKRLTDFAKKIEASTLEPFKKANTLRSQADKKSKISEKLPLLIEAEKIETGYLAILQKALYAYLSWPKEYDLAWVLSEKTENPILISPTTKPDSTENTLARTDSAVKLVSYARVQKDTTKLPQAKDTLRAVKPDTTVQLKNPEPKADSTIRPQPKVIKTDSTLTTKPGFKKPLPKPDDAVVGNDSSLYGKVKVNEEQIDQFNSFLKKTYPKDYENYVIDFQKLDYTNLNSMKDAWHNYLYAGQIPSDSLKGQVALADTARADSIPITGQVLAENLTKGSIDAAKTKKTSKKQAGKKTLTSGEVTEADLSTIVDSAGFIFRVQIVASRSKINDSILAGIYKGSEKIDELFEDKWYKYAIGFFPTYKQARKLRDQVKVPGAFVIAYVNGKRIKITPAVVYKRRVQADGQPNASVKQSNDKYRIQIAASHVPLSENVLKGIYSGTLTINVMQEDGWYKYYILAGNGFTKAQELLKSLAIPGAFIIAYNEVEKNK